jgi:hypothetical protein
MSICEHCDNSLKPCVHDIEREIRLNTEKDPSRLEIATQLLCSLVRHGGYDKLYNYSTAVTIADKLIEECRKTHK